MDRVATESARSSLMYGRYTRSSRLGLRKKSSGAAHQGLSRFVIGIFNLTLFRIDIDEVRQLPIVHLAFCLDGDFALLLRFDDIARARIENGVETQQASGHR